MTDIFQDGETPRQGIRSIWATCDGLSGSCARFRQAEIGHEHGDVQLWCRMLWLRRSRAGSPRYVVTDDLPMMWEPQPEPQRVRTDIGLPGLLACQEKTTVFGMGTLPGAGGR